MLERLNSVDWARLTHAYGEAADVPDLIRSLTSNDEEERRDALGSLFGTIWHQGTVYEATAFAVPFLIELLADPGVEGKEEILQLLACIADGHSYLDVHGDDGSGMVPASEQERVDREARLARELRWVRAACDAVEAGAEIYLDLLNDHKPEIRIFAAYTLGHCQGRAAQIVPALIARASFESDARSQAAVILALGSLKGVVDAQRQIGNLLAARIEPNERPIVRLVATMCLARAYPVEPAPELLDALAAAIGSAWSDFEALPWCDGDVAVVVGEALAEYPLTRLRFLLGLLDSEDANVRSSARLAVEQLCQERRSVTVPAAAALREHVLVGDLAARHGTVEILSRLGSAATVAVGPLHIALQDDDAQLRSYAAIALARLQDPRAIPVLISLLNNDHLFPQIVKALGRFGAAARDAVPALLDVLNCKPPREPLLAHNRPIEVAVTLGQIGSEARAAVSALIALMRKQPHTQRATTMALGQIGGNEARAAVPFLKKLLCSQDELTRIRAAQTLWQLDRSAAQVLPVLIELLQPGMKNRSLAAEALGAMGAAAQEAVAALRACLDDRSFHAIWVHLKAAQALWQIDRNADVSLPVLIGLLRNLGKVGALVATQAAETLGEMGVAAQEAVPVLRAALSGDIRPFGGSIDELVTQDEAFCSAAAEALRRIEGV